jgi:hypothetical protein
LLTQPDYSAPADAAGLKGRVLRRIPEMVATAVALSSTDLDRME